MSAPDRGELIVYRTGDGQAEVQLQTLDGSVWLNQGEMAELFDTTKQNISLHIKNILKEGELPEASVVKEYLTTAEDGKRYQTKHYNLHMILAVGYRVRSPRGTQFRQWATAHLAEYLVKGFVMDDERLKNPGGWDYFDELLARIRALIRRHAGAVEPVFSQHGVALNPATREATRDGVPVSLSAREWAVLEPLLARPGVLFSRAQLEEKMFSWKDEVSSNAVEVYIHGVRKKLGSELIQTVRGLGYMVPKE